MGKVSAAAGFICMAAACFSAEPYYEIVTVAGSDRMGDGGPALAAQISQPESLAVDAQGNMYIADPANHRVRKISPFGIISTLAGTGHEGFSGDGGPAASARLRQPYGVAVDGQGNVYIADTYNHRVRKVDASGIIRTIAGTGEKGTTGDGKLAVDAPLMAPRNLAFDRAENLYVSEFEGHRIRRIAKDMITTVAGTGVAGFNEDGPALLTQLSSPASLAVDPAGALYVVDRENLRVRKLSGGFLTTVYGGRENPGWPTGVACDRTGALYIAEAERARVRKLLPNGDAVTYAGTTGAGYDGDNKPALSAKLAWPRDLAFDLAGALYVSDLRRVRRISTAGMISSVAGDGTFGFGGDRGPAAEAYLRFPRGIALDRNGDLYVADTGNGRVRKIATADGTITTIAGGGESTADGKPALETALRDPLAAGFDAWGNLVISDSGNHRVRRLMAGILTTIAGTGLAGRGADGSNAGSMPVSQPGKSALDSIGNLYLVDRNNHRVLKVTPSGVATVFAGNGTAGLAGDGGRAAIAQLSSPASVAVDSANNVYIADAANHRIRKVTLDGIITTVAGAGTSGQGPAGPALEAPLASPCAVAADGEVLYVADVSTVRRIEAGRMTVIAGGGWAGFEGDGGPSLDARLSNPCDLAVDRTGQIFITDSGNHRVRKLVPKERPAIEKPAPVTTPVRVFHAATLEEGPVAPGQIVSLIGPQIGPADAVSGFDTGFGDTRVLFDGRPAVLFYASATQVNAQAPYAIAGQPSTVIEVLAGTTVRGSATIPVAPTAPGLFTAEGGTGQVVAVNQDGSINSQANPASRGSIVTLFATGEGATEPASSDGKVAAAPYPKPRSPVRLTIGGTEAELLYAGAAPGFAGLMQVNARVPGAFTPAGMLPVVLRVGAAESRHGVVIAVK